MGRWRTAAKCGADDVKKYAMNENIPLVRPDHFLELMLELYGLLQ
jgi:hypothetical protein